MSSSGERPSSWANWRAHLDGTAAISGNEFDLHSDSVIWGDAREFGPFTVMNLIAGKRRETALSRPVMTLRVRYSSGANPHDNDAEHGGHLRDEFAALISLVLGIRLQSSGAKRFFKFSDPETLGEPRALAEVETPALLPGAWTEIIAHARREANLSELDLLESYPKLDATTATALMRAARLYQEALWVSERQAWLTWLLLVSAIETAANAYKYDGNDSPSDLLRELDPTLAKAAAKYGDECVAAIAKTQVKMLGATKKFVGFLETFLPDEPKVRPSKYQLSWTKDGLTAPLKAVYRLRSSYLHAGVPFSWRLRMAPEPVDGVPSESFPDVGGDQSAPSDPNLPMHVHVFEHIARGALLNWWRNCVAASNEASLLGVGKS
jgi:hypothetical protein